MNVFRVAANVCMTSRTPGTMKGNATTILTVPGLAMSARHAARIMLVLAGAA